MGRTVPSFRNVLAQEKQEWKLFRNALGKSERKSFDEMWDIPRLYITSCSNSVSLVPFHPIAMSILFHHYKELMECERQIKLIDNNYSRNGISKRKEHSQNDMVVVKAEDYYHLRQEREQLTLFDF